MFPKYFQFMSLHFKSTSIYDFLLRKKKKVERKSCFTVLCRSSITIFVIFGKDATTRYITFYQLISTDSTILPQWIFGFISMYL